MCLLADHKSVSINFVLYVKIISAVPEKFVLITLRKLQ